MPDEALARVYDVVPHEVARRRAAAIERLADELGAQRGEDLGAVLQALLDEGSWTVTEEAGNGDGEPEGEAGPDEQEEAREEDEQDEQPDANDEQPGTEEEQPDDEDAEPVAEETPVVPVPTEPVLEMLAAREGVRGPGADDAGRGRQGSRRGVVAIAVASFVAAVIGGAAAFVGLSSGTTAEPAAPRPPSRPTRA